MKISSRQMSLTDLEQAERMAEKLEARAEAFWIGGDGWGFGTVGYCTTDEEADEAKEKADTIRQAIVKVQYAMATEEELAFLRRAIGERNGLDTGVQMSGELRRCSHE